MLEHNPFTFLCSCTSPMPFCDICFNKMCTTSMRQSSRTSTALSTLLFLSLFHNRSATQDSRNVLIITGIAEIPCRRSPFAMNCSEVIVFSASVLSIVLATSTELFRFFGSLPTFSLCLNTHTLTHNCASSFSCEENTKVDASNHKHSLLDDHLFALLWVLDTCLITGLRLLMVIVVKNAQLVFTSEN